MDEKRVARMKNKIGIIELEQLFKIIWWIVIFIILGVGIYIIANKILS